MNYQAILFHPEGDNVRDFQSETKQEVIEQLWDIGSKWIFYPLHFVATEKTIVDTPQGLEFLKNKRIKTVRQYLENTWKDNADEICEYINSGFPLNHVYPEI